MKFATLFAALAALPAVLGLTINTPVNVVECQPTQFAWSGGNAPYYLSLVPAGQPSAPPLKQFAQQSGTSYSWNVDLQSGTSFTIVLKAGDGSTAFSDIITIGPGSSTACVNLAVQETGDSGSSPSATGAAGSSTSAAPSASGSPASHSNGAGRLSSSAALGVAGIMGLVGAALF